MNALFDVPESWKSSLSEELEKPYFQKLIQFIDQERRGSVPVYPPEKEVFNALRFVNYNAVKVVIMGQDPYHGPGQAHGLSFSVPEGVRLPPSLRNIFKEVEADLGLPMPESGCLLSWAEQGVLLLNATLTVRHQKAKSHFGQGWELFTDAIIRAVGRRQQPTVFMLWGNSAKDKVSQIEEVGDEARHLILSSPHPSPLSAYTGFFGNRHFSRANAFIKAQGLEAIDWGKRSLK